MRCTSHLLVIWEAKSRILFSKIYTNNATVQRWWYFEVCIRRSPNTYGKITEVHFTYQYPNLGRVNEKIKELLGDTGKDMNSTESEVSFKGKSLEFDENNKNVQDLVSESSKSGNPIKMKIKGIRGFVHTGEKSKQIELEELDFEGDPLAFSKLLDSLNNCL